MRNLPITLLSVVLLGARHETPIHTFDRPAHDVSCDYAVSKQAPRIAANLCLQAADEWAHLAANHSKQVEGRYDEFMEAVTRLETANSMREAHIGYAFDQMSLAVSISAGICSNRQLLKFELAVCNDIAETAAKSYPKMWKLEESKVP